MVRILYVFLIWFSWLRFYKNLFTDYFFRVFRWNKRNFYLKKTMCKFVHLSVVEPRKNFSIFFCIYCCYQFFNFFYFSCICIVRKQLSNHVKILIFFFRIYHYYRCFNFFIFRASILITYNGRSIKFLTFNQIKYI